MLRELQRSFAASMLDEENDAVCGRIAEDGFAVAERLRIYRNTCRSALVESLRLTYPAAERLVGREFFDTAAAQYVGAHPAQSGYLNEYGSGFADFLAAYPASSALAYLADVAHFEWALSAAANAEDAGSVDLRALGAADAEASLRFRPHPSVRFLVLAYPADEIADAVLAGDDAAMASIDLASGPVRLVVHRGPGGVEAQRLDPPAYDFVSRLCAGEPLASLLKRTTAADPSELLAEQLAKGRLAAFDTDR